MMYLEEDEPTEIEFKVGDKVMHKDATLWGTVMGFFEHLSLPMIIVKHEDPKFRDDGNGLKAWINRELRRANMEVIADIQLERMRCSAAKIECQSDK